MQCGWRVLVEEIESVRPVIEVFAAEVFAGFARRDQRTMGQLYLPGLLAEASGSRSRDLFRLQRRPADLGL